MSGKLKLWSTTPANNNSSPPNGWPEGMAPSAVNNTARQDRASVAEWYTDAEWIDYGTTVVTAAGQVYTLSGNLTATYTVGRAIRQNGSSIGIITASTFSTPNTLVTVSGYVPSAAPTSVELGLGDKAMSRLSAGTSAVDFATYSGNIQYKVGGVTVALMTSTGLNAVNIGATTPGTVAATTLSTTGDVTVGGGTGSRIAIVNGAKDTANSDVQLYASGVVRWAMRRQSTAESGSDAGSNFNLNAYTDAGAAIDTPLAITRAAGGQITLARPLVMTNGTLIMAPASGGSAFDLRAAASGQQTTIQMRTGTSIRWSIDKNATAESGSNAGSSLAIGAYDDAGTSIDFPVVITRAAGGAILMQRPTGFGTNQIAGTNFNVAGGAINNTTIGATTPSTVAATTLSNTGILTNTSPTNGSVTASFTNTSASGAASGMLAGFYSNDGAAMAVNDRLALLLFGGASNASNTIRNTAGVRANATENWVDTSAYGTNLQFEVTANGSTSRNAVATLTSSALTLTGGVSFEGALGVATQNTVAFTTAFANANGGATTVRIGRDANNGMFFGANSVSLATNGVERVQITSDGRLYGTALHNNAGAVTGTTNQYIASGTYTPTLTAVTGATGLSAGVAQWMRVGNVVTVSGAFAATAASGNNRVGITLPIPSTLVSSVANCAGTIASSAVNANAGAVYSDGTNNRAEAYWVQPVTGAAQNYHFHFTYQVV